MLSRAASLSVLLAAVAIPVTVALHLAPVVGICTAPSAPFGVRATAQMQVGALLEFAPPAGPPAGYGGDGGDDGGDDGGEFLRLIDVDETRLVLQDWSSRSRIYKMSDNKDVVASQELVLESLTSVIEFNEHKPHPSTRRLTLGLFDHSDDLWALAAVEISSRAGLVVHSVSGCSTKTLP